jgi:cobalamin biosynthesis Mg chelatase CobN
MKPTKEDNEIYTKEITDMYMNGETSISKIEDRMKAKGYSTGKPIIRSVISKIPEIASKNNMINRTIFNNVEMLESEFVKAYEDINKKLEIFDEMDNSEFKRKVFEWAAVHKSKLKLLISTRSHFLKKQALAEGLNNPNTVNFTQMNVMIGDRNMEYLSRLERLGHITVNDEVLKREIKRQQDKEKEIIALKQENEL